MTELCTALTTRSSSSIEGERANCAGPLGKLLVVVGKINAVLHRGVAPVPRPNTQLNRARRIRKTLIFLFFWARKSKSQI